MQIDKPEGAPDRKVAWGSDIAAQMLRRLGIPYVSLNPGASYRGLHDSLVNHLGNTEPGMLLCLHEDHSVAIAHGYAKATGEPMACVLHSNVGLMHGMMSLYNAWCDRAPMIVLGATGPLDAEKRRPWIDWIHTSRDQGGADPFVHQMGRPAELRPGARRIDVPRQSHDPQRADRAGLYLSRRRPAGAAARQGAGVARHGALQAAGAGAARAERGRCRRRRCSRMRKRPLIMFGRGARDADGLAARVAARRAARRLRGDRPQARARCSRPIIRRIPCRRSTCRGPARANPVRGRRHPRARLGRSRRRAAAGQDRRQAVGARSSAPRSTITCTPAPTWNISRCRRSTSRWRPTPTRSSTICSPRSGPGQQGAVEGEARPRKPRATGDGAALTLEHVADRAARRVQRPRERHASARSAAAGRSTSGRSRTAWPISARTAAAGSARARGFRSAPRSRSPTGAATRSRCSATAISAWA